MSSKKKDVKQHPLTDDFVAALSRDLEVRVNQGVSLQDALRETLELRAPVELYEEGSRSSGSSTLGWLFTLGLLGAAAYGANLAAKEFLGKGLTELAQDRTGSGSNGDYSYQASERYSANNARSGATTGAAASTMAGTASASGMEASSKRRFEDYDEDFRTHHKSTYGSSGRDYEAYKPAYEYGHRYATESDYEGRSYSDLEPEMRRSYEEEHGKGSFEDVQGATRHSFERSRKDRSSGGTSSGVKSPSGSSRTASGDPGSVTRKGDDK